MHCRVIIADASSAVSISRVIRICRTALVLSSVPTRPHTATNYDPPASLHRDHGHHVPDRTNYGPPRRPLRMTIIILTVL